MSVDIRYLFPNASEAARDEIKSAIEKLYVIFPCDEESREKSEKKLGEDLEEARSADELSEIFDSKVQSILSGIDVKQLSWDKNEELKKIIKLMKEKLDNFGDIVNKADKKMGEIDNSVAEQIKETVEKELSDEEKGGHKKRESAGEMNPFE